MEYQLIAPRDPFYSPIEQVLVNRGIKLDDIHHYLNTTDEDILPAAAITNIHRGVEMLAKHI